MAPNYKVVQFRRGTTIENQIFTGVQGEVTVDTDKNILIVHNGTTEGGFPVRSDAATEDRPRYLTFRAVITQQGIPSLGFSAANNAPIPTAVTNDSGLVTGVATFSYQGNQSVQDHFCVPSDFAPPMAVEVVWRTSETQGEVIWGLETLCVSNNGLLENATFNASQTVATIVGLNTPNALITSTITNVDTTGFVSEGECFFRLTRLYTDTVVGDAELVSLRFVILARSK